MTLPRVDLCAPEIFGGFGGIQTYMRLLARALQKTNHLGRVYSLNDSEEDARNAELYSEFEFPFEPANGSKSRLVFDLKGKSTLDTFLLHGHVNQAPVGFLLKKCHQISGYGIILHGVEAWERLSLPKRLALDHADLVISTTPYTRAEVEEKNNVSPVRHEILPLAVEPGRFSTFEPSRQTGNTNPTLDILTVARLEANERYKGIDHVLAAIAECRHRDVSVRYRVVGDGDDRGRLQRVTRSLSLDERVIFLGNVSDSELDECFEWADAFAMPSGGEGFGLVYLEAMHYGLPVIASPEGGAQHVIEDDRDGLMVEYGNVEEIAKALEALTQPSLRDRLSRGARKSVETKFSFRRFAEQLEDILASEST